MSKSYTGEQISTLAPLEGIRQKLGMYVGSNSNDAVHHIVKEIISNAIDEYLAGYGDKIEIIVDEKENKVSVRDYGRGIPPEKMDDVLTKTHTSGKFEKGSGAAYGASGGLNG
jgi:DNA gyrase subunit B